MKSKILIAILIITIIVAILLINLQGAKQESIKIGIITDLTGPAAYWGESTRVGAEIAVEELQKEGINVTLIFEDYQLDSRKALTSAQKLINIDNVDAIYAEFNPAAISVGSLVKDKNILFVYDAAPTSPLKDSPYTYKTYLNYQEGCREIAKKFSVNLFREGVFATPIVFPMVVKGKARIRVIPSASHSKKDLDIAVKIFAKVAKNLKVL